MTIQERHLIERYLKGDLSGFELEEFKRQLLADDDFRRKIERQETLYTAVDTAWRKQQQARILSELNYRKPLVPTALKLILVFFVTLFGIISLWFYTGRQTTVKESMKPIISLFQTTNKKTERAVATKAPKQEVVVEENEPVASNEVVQDSLNDQLLTEDSLSNEEVKQDKILMSITLTAVDVSEKNAEDNLADNTIKKLNPEADLPVVEAKSNNYVVEFWLSPVNYEGYKMSKNKIVLFGIEYPDAVKLYRLNENLYMSYLKNIYRLENTNDFRPYIKVKDSDIPQQLTINH